MRALASCALLLALLAGPASASASGPFGRAGRWIVDDQGRATVVNGWNIVNKRPPYTPEAMGFGEDDAAFLREQGFDTVRLAIVWKALEPKPGQYDEAYLDSVERTYDLLARNGISVLLSFHQDMYNERFQGEGFPDWTVLGDARWLPRPHLGFPVNYAFGYAMQRAYDHFWNNERGPDGRRLWDAYAQAWVHVAERFSREGGAAGLQHHERAVCGDRGVRLFQEVAGVCTVRRSPAHAVQPLRDGGDPHGRSHGARLVQPDGHVQLRDPYGARPGERRPVRVRVQTYCQYTAATWPLGFITWYHLGQSCSYSRTSCSGWLIASLRRTTAASS